MPPPPPVQIPPAPLTWFGMNGPLWLAVRNDACPTMLSDKVFNILLLFSVAERGS